MTTINDFVNNRFALSNLEYLTPLDGLTYENLPRPMQRRIRETELVVHVIEPGTPEEVMFNIFQPHQHGRHAAEREKKFDMRYIRGLQETI